MLVEHHCILMLLDISKLLGVVLILSFEERQVLSPITLLKVRTVMANNHILITVCLRQL